MFDGYFDILSADIHYSSFHKTYTLFMCRYQRMKALQVEKEKIVHEMFMEDLEKQKEEKLQLT